MLIETPLIPFQITRLPGRSRSRANELANQADSEEIITEEESSGSRIDFTSVERDGQFNELFINGELPQRYRQARASRRRHFARWTL